MFRILAFAFFALVMCPLPFDEAAAKSVHKEFLESWDERLARYGLQQQMAAVRLKDASDALGQAMKENQSDINAQTAAFFSASDELGYVVARAELTRKLIQFMAMKPSSTRAELWFQEQMSELAEAERVTRAEFERVAALKIGEGNVTSASLAISMGETVFRKGAWRGQLDELKLAGENLATYYREKDERDSANRARWAAALGSLGQSLQAQSQRQNGFMMTCTTLGSFTNCNGN